MISPEIKEEIKYRCDIVDVISTYVTLKRAGSNYNACCPFHSERTPSFTVFPATRSFYCFGCGAGGDVITFIMKRENLDYRSAMEMLANRAGITLPADDKRGDPEERSVKRERILSMNREAARFFHACLYDRNIGSSALGYLTGRGLSGSVIKHFGLGYAPDGFGALTDHLTKQGYTPEEMSVGFLCGISKKSGRPFDYFRNRVMFPIIDVTGNVVAFGGRVMDDSIPKYLNTSDTPAFKKSRNLFALNYAKGCCQDRLILCEGYMDVIALHAHGFENAVATLGTAITDEQARIMAKYTKQVIISYDADEAGQRAANKAMKLLSEVGLDVRVLRITGAKDPDEFLKKNGPNAPEKFRYLLDNSRAQFEFKLEGVLSRHDVSIVDEKVKASAELCRIISEVYSAAEREVYIGVVAEKLQIPRESLKNDVRRIIRDRTKSEQKEEMRGILNKTAGYGDRVNPDTVKSTAAVSTEENILGILLLFPENLAAVKSGKISLAADDFFSEFNRRVFAESLSRCHETGNFDFSLLNEVFNPDEMGRITSMVIKRRQLSENGPELLRTLIDKLRSEKRQQELAGDELAQIADILQRKRAKNS
ncbi:MAG: DNA primase [Ruminococcaceae bacterium]|nr:DNA primase [Oscillospiraceae bacterium]